MANDNRKPHVSVTCHNPWGSSAGPELQPAMEGQLFPSSAQDGSLPPGWASHSLPDPMWRLVLSLDTSVASGVTLDTVPRMHSPLLLN